MSKICNGNEITGDVQEITIIFNNHFINAPINVANSLQFNCNLNYRSYCQVIAQSLLLRPVTVDGIIKIGRELKNCTSVNMMLR